MRNIFFTYIKLAIVKYYGGKPYKFIIWNILIPFTITISLYHILGSNKIVDIFTKSSQELINAFSIISGFLLASISIILATTEINETNLPTLQENLKTNKEGVKIIINELKKILLYEVGIQFILIIIITLLIAITKVYTECKVLSFTTLLLGITSFTLIIKLLRNFLQFERITLFNLPKEK